MFKWIGFFYGWLIGDSAGARVSVAVPENVWKKRKFRRGDPAVVRRILNELAVAASQTFVEYYEAFGGPAFSEALQLELGDIAVDYGNVRDTTMVLRNVHSGPKRYLALSELQGSGEFLVYDTETDRVYVADETFEDIFRGEAVPFAESFYEFLELFFADCEA